MTSDPAGWTPPDFCVVARFVDDEDAFRAHVAELAQHRRDIARLDRPEAASGTPTPWGAAQVSRIYADGVIWHATAEHGGFRLDPVRNALVSGVLNPVDSGVGAPEWRPRHDKRCHVGSGR